MKEPKSEQQRQDRQPVWYHVERIKKRYNAIYEYPMDITQQCDKAWDVKRRKANTLI